MSTIAANLQWIIRELFEIMPDLLFLVYEMSREILLHPHSSAYKTHPIPEDSLSLRGEKNFHPTLVRAEAVGLKANISCLM